jgi:hypothetical protein
MIVLLDMPSLLRAVLFVAVVVNSYRTITLHALRRGKNAVVALRLTSDGELLMRMQSGRSWRSATIENRFVHPKLVLLRTHCEGRRFTDTLMVAADASNSETFRRLRATLLAPPRKRGA